MRAETDKDTQRALIRALAATGEQFGRCDQEPDRLEGSGGSRRGDSRAGRWWCQRSVAAPVAAAATAPVLAPQPNGRCLTSGVGAPVSRSASAEISTGWPRFSAIQLHGSCSTLFRRNHVSHEPESFSLACSSRSRRRRARTPATSRRSRRKSQRGDRLNRRSRRRPSAAAVGAGCRGGARSGARRVAAYLRVRGAGGRERRVGMVRRAVIAGGVGDSESHSRHGAREARRERCAVAAGQSVEHRCVRARAVGAAARASARHRRSCPGSSSVSARGRRRRARSPR